MDSLDNDYSFWNLQWVKNKTLELFYHKIMAKSDIQGEIRQ